MLLEKAGLGGLGRAADTSGDNVDSFLRGEHGHHTVESYISFQSDIRWVPRAVDIGINCKSQQINKLTNI